MSKRYITMSGVQDKMWCDMKYPHPIYFDRPNNRMPKRELKAMLALRIDESRRMTELLERLAAIDVENERLRNAINALHDFRNAMGVFTAEAAGMPHLWEE
jgi:hypothetical protein